MSMTGSFDISFPLDTGSVALEEISPLIETMPSYWTAGTEVGWTEYAWGVLESEGLTAFEDAAEQVLVICRLVTLTAVVRAFADVSSGAHLDWEDAVHTGPEAVAETLDPIALGRLAERLDLHGSLDEREGVAELASAVAREEWAEVTSALRHGMGDTQLFGSLWAARSTDTVYPIDDEALDDITRTVTTDNGAAYEWISTGLPI